MYSGSFIISIIFWVIVFIVVIVEVNDISKGERNK